MTVVIVTGASGAGKTAIATKVATLGGVRVHHFDSIGVPTPEGMIEEYGSPEGWQLAATQSWMRRLEAEAKEHPDLLLEGQMRLSFIASTARIPCETILLDCDDDTRIRRLVGRGQAHLADETMMKWASWLRAEALDLASEILDTTSLTVDEAAEHIHARFANSRG